MTMTKVSLDVYLAAFSEEPVEVCFSRGRQSMYGREGSYYCANCNVWIGDVYAWSVEKAKEQVPMKNEKLGHCFRCLEENVNAN